MLYSDGKMPQRSAQSAVKEVPMEQRSTLSSFEMITSLRRRLEEAYSQDDFTEAQVLSRQMDGIQLLRWKDACPEIVIPKS